MIAHILSLGDELTTGQTVDTNTAWIAQRLGEFGVTCERHVTVADALEPIRHSIDDAAGRCELLIVTGGLGPTPDDLTREGLAAAMGVELFLDESALRDVEAYFAQRNRRMHEANRRQAMIPVSAEALKNATGTAPGIRARLHRADVYCLPGVPSEMREMFERHIAPTLHGEGATNIRILRSFGISESEIGERLGDLMRRDRNPRVGTSASELIISIRIVARGDDARQARSLAAEDVATVHERLGVTVFGDGEATIESAVGTLLLSQAATISTAESCTGGLIAKRLTDLAGSSAYFRQAFVTYSNDSKVSLLGVNEEDLRRFGAVSEPVAAAMAENCRTRSGTDYALSCTGIAGPGGATPTKPVGLVYVAIATAAGTTVKELRIGENITRAQVRDRTAKALLNWLRLKLIRAE